MSPQQPRHLTPASRGLWDRIRWRACWLLMPSSLWLAQEKRRLEQVAVDSGASRSVSKRIAAEYFRALRNER